LPEWSRDDDADGPQGGRRVRLARLERLARGAHLPHVDPAARPAARGRIDALVAAY
jgi:hypothetical protein